MPSGHSSRARLAAVVREGGDLIRVDDVVAALRITRPMAGKLLARWEHQHWLKRLRRGLYAPVPLALSPSEQVLEDPWTLVPELFAPGYIGGATAAQHWDLTEQIFRTVFVYTARPIRSSDETIQGIPFQLRHISRNRFFGTTSLWRGRTRIQISDLHRTIVDLLDDPSAGGGIRHVEDCLRAYFSRKDTEPTQIIDYAVKMGNGAIFKRLGFLAEKLKAPASLVAACSEHLTTGNAKLDPALPSPRLVRRWRIWIPDFWKDGART